MRKNFVIIIAFLTCSFYNLHAQTLEDYFKIAAENNPGLQSKYKGFEAAMQRVAQVSSLPDPNLSFGYFIWTVETRLGPQKARLSLTQMFPWFGTLRAQEEAATLLAEAKYQEFLDERNKLLYQVSAAYYPLYELNKILYIETENEAILTSYKDIATIKFQNGQGAMVDVLRVDIMLKDASTNVSILTQKAKPLETRFNKLLNRNETDTIFMVEHLSRDEVEQDYRRDSLLLANPLLVELELKIMASEASEQAAIKQGLPKLGVGLDYVIVGERTDISITDNGKDVLMPMVSISLPIFRGKYKAAQKEAQLMQQSFALQKVEMSNRLTISYDMVSFDIRKQEELIQLYDEQLQISEQSLNLLFTAYGNSGKDFEEVLRMQQQLLKYQKMKATTLTAFHTAIAELDYITAKSIEL
ncbi:MAG: TolC family protein [Reichenbachiella sp.]